ncbi:hypothetical protein D3C76_1150320 [compost metagenome]
MGQPLACLVLSAQEWAHGASQFQVLDQRYGVTLITCNCAQALIRDRAHHRVRSGNRQLPHRFVPGLQGIEQHVIINPTLLALGSRQHMFSR